MARSVEVVAAALPEYEVLRELGRGAMGVVYLGRHKHLDRDVAIKELPAAFGADPAMRHRFGVEARVLASMNHPHVVPVFDYVESGGVCLLVMEALPGGTVWDRFLSDGLTMPRACAVILATCSALEHAHGQGVLHRDIKPENLMFGAADAVKVTDFGIAKVLNGSRTMATADGSVLGTPAYMAPEQAEGAELTPQVDVYAAGTMLYEMLSGRLPFDESQMTAMLVARVNGDPPDLRTVAPDVPAELAAVVMQAIARRPSDRYATAEEFGCALGMAAATVWGAEWLTTAGVPVQGSESISRAARTTLTPVVEGAATTGRATAGPAADLDARTRSDGTLAGGTEVVGRDAVPAQPSGTEVVGRIDPQALPEPEVEVTAENPPHVRASPPQPAPATVVRPTRRAHEVGFDESDLDAEFVDIADAIHPPGPPLAAALGALALALIGIVIAVIGVGSPPLDQLLPAGTTIAGADVATSDQIDIDLDDAIAVSGLPPGTAAVELSFDVVGVPLGATETADVVAGSAEIDTGIAPRLVTGGVVGTLALLGADGTVSAEHQISVSATNPWFTSAFGVGAVLLVLFSLAAVESNLRPMRRGRRRVGSLVGLALSGAVVGAAIALLATAVLATERTVAGVAVPALFCAGAAVVAGLAAARSGRRRRIKRRLEARRIDAGRRRM
ncbi:MAG: protein kinase domain-containing protein [Acidimicrobiales bacterium]